MARAVLSPSFIGSRRDADGEVTSVVDPGGASYQYVYDQDGRVIRTRMAPADLEQPAANQSNATLGQGNNGGSGSSPCNVYPFSLSIGDVLQMSVTATGFVPTLVLLRPSGVLTASNGFYVSATSGNTLTLTFTADAAGTWDVLVSSTPGSHGTFSFTCQVDPVLPTAMLETDNTYDADGNLTKVTDTLGQQTVYTYDAVGDLTRATQGTVSGGIYTVDHRADFTYNADGSLATITRYLGDGTLTAVTSTYGYNDAGQLTSLVHAHDGSALASYVWGYDLAGNMTSQQSAGFDYFTEDGSGDVTGEAAEQGSSTYTYDHANQQTSESDNYPNDYSLGENYAYDGNGNRTGCTTGAGNELTFDGTYTYTYDADGNCTAKFIDVHGTGALAAGDTDVTLYSWDYANRLVQAQLENVYGTVTETIKYTYDYQNRRIEEIVTPAGAGSQYSYLAYQGDQPYAQFSGQVSGSSFAETDLFLAAPTVDQVLADWQNEGTVAKPAWQVNWLLPDQEGTIRDLAAYITVCGSGPTGMASTFVLTHRDYDSFGNLVQTDYNVAPAINTIIGYSGGIYDANLNLVQFVDRWYDPNTGRFLSPDPTGFAGGLSNLYCYCGNNPLTQTDPTGDQQGYAGSGVVFAAGYNSAPISLTESCPSAASSPYVSNLTSFITGEPLPAISSGSVASGPGSAADRNLAAIAQSEAFSEDTGGDMVVVPGAAPLTLCASTPAAPGQAVSASPPPPTSSPSLLQSYAQSLVGTATFAQGISDRVSALNYVPTDSADQLLGSWSPGAIGFSTTRSLVAGGFSTAAQVYESEANVLQGNFQGLAQQNAAFGLGVIRLTPNVSGDPGAAAFLDQFGSAIDAPHYQRGVVSSPFVQTVAASAIFAGSPIGEAGAAAGGLDALAGEIAVPSEEALLDSSIFEEVPYDLSSESIIVGGEPQPIVSQELAMRGPEMPGTVDLQPYGGWGGGHHVLIDCAFDGAPGYDSNAALAIPNDELARLGVVHELVSAEQHTLYSAFGRTGATLTWDAMQQIETQALVKGNMNPEIASETVQRAIQALKNAGVSGPTRTPWGR